MGKRELVLIALFVAVGIVVYQFRAQPPAPGQEGVSFGGIVQKLKREVQGSRAVATATRTESRAVAGSVRLVRFNLPRNNTLIITGSDRADIAAEMQVSARGFDQAEAKAAADAAQIKVEEVGDAIAVTTIWPMRNRDQPGFISDGTITVSLPKRLLVRVEPHAGRLTISDVAGVEVMGSRGETRVLRTAGHVAVGHTGGRLEIDGAPSLKLTARNSDGSIARVAGSVTIDATGAELELQELTGPVDIEGRNAEFVLDAGTLAKPPFRFNGTGGLLRVVGLRTEGRIDGRNVELDLALAAAAAITVYSTGENIAVTAPPGGYTVDAVATEGRISTDDGGLTASEEGENEQRLDGQVRGGGPTLTLRATRAEIHIRKPAGK